MKRKERKLTRLILTTLMCAGGGLIDIPSANAEETVTKTIEQNLPSVELTVNGESINSEESYMSGNDYVFGNVSFRKKYGSTNVNYTPVINPATTLTVAAGEDNALRLIQGGACNDASNYMVKMTGGTLGYLYGGYSGAITSANDNTVTITGGTIINCVMGGFSENADATGNTVTISGGTIGGTVTGGVSVSGDDVTDNTVTISGGTISREVAGGQALQGAANNNTVEITGGTVNGSVYGGNGTTADGNTVTISGGTIAADSYIHGAFANTSATTNTVNILTQIAVGGLAGGELMDSGTSSGNTLNVAAKGVSTGDLYAFQNINFYLPTDMTTSDVMLTVNGTATVTDAKVGVLAQGTLANLAKDDKVTLLSAGTLTGTVTQTTEITVPTSITTVDTYEFSVTSDENNIYATITKDDSGSGGGGGGDTPSDPAEDAKKSPVETRAAAVTLLNAGADMLASQGFAQAANAVALEAAEQAKNAEPGAAAPAASTFTPFAAFGGSSMRAESGSHVDTKGFGINVGFAKEFANSQGKLLFGPVVEYGGGTYDSYNNDTHGDGKSHYWGVGVMARQVNHDGFYYEGSVRGGRVTSDYSADIANNAGGTNHVSYDSTSNYWAAHLGLGKVFAAGEKGVVDGYLKYFYSHQSGDDVTLNGAGERASFDSVDSHRIRIGARYTHKVNEMNSFYGGLAYQYEFGGEARAHYSVSGEAPSPSVKGSSGMLELGWQVKPGGPVTIDLGVTGWAGKQRGGSVQLGATWTF